MFLGTFYTLEVMSPELKSEYTFVWIKRDETELQTKVTMPRPIKLVLKEEFSSQKKTVDFAWEGEPLGVGETLKLILTCVCKGGSSLEVEDISSQKSGVFVNTQSLFEPCNESADKNGFLKLTLSRGISKSAGNQVHLVSLYTDENKISWDSSGIN